MLEARSLTTVHQLHKLTGISYRQPVQQKRVDKAENCRVGPHSKSRESTATVVKPGIAAHPSKSITKIGPQFVPPAKAESRTPPSLCGTRGRQTLFAPAALLPVRGRHF